MIKKIQSNSPATFKEIFDTFEKVVEIDKLLDKARDSNEYYAEYFRIEFHEAVSNYMEKNNVSYIKLAKKIGCSPYVLKENLNEQLSFQNICEILRALKATIKIEIKGLK